MELRLDRDAFLKGLQTVQSVVEPRQTLPILANVLMETQDGALRLTATDLQVAVRITVPATIVGKGATTLSARKLAEIAKELPQDELTLKLQENAWVVLRCGHAVYKLIGMAPEEFPQVEPAGQVRWHTVDGNVLRRMLEQTHFAASHDEGRYALNGVLFCMRDGELRLVATDGHRLALATRAMPGLDSTSSAGIVPRKAVHEVMRVLALAGEAQIALGERQFVLQMANFLLTARLIEGQFPQYEQVVPKGQARRLVLAKDGLAAALRRVSILSEERTKPVKFLLSAGALKLSVYNPEMGEAEETLAVEYTGDDLTIGFNSRYLLDALGPVAADRVVIELKDGTSPGVLKSIEEEGSLCVIMPMRI